MKDDSRGREHLAYIRFLTLLMETMLKNPEPDAPAFVAVHCCAFCMQALKLHEAQYPRA